MPVDKVNGFCKRCNGKKRWLVRCLCMYRCPWRYCNGFM